MTNDKPPFVGEKVKLGNFITASTQRNKNANCTDVYSVTNSCGFTPSEEYFSKEVFSKDLTSYRVVKRGMIAYNPSRINVGSIALQDKLSEVVVSPLYVVFSVDESKLLPEFVLNFLKSNPGLSQIAFRSTGTVRNNLKFEALCKLEIPSLSLENQQKCVQRLKAVSNQIDLLRNYLDNLDRLVKSQFVDLCNEVSELLLERERRERN